LTDEPHADSVLSLDRVYSGSRLIFVGQPLATRALMIDKPEPPLPAALVGHRGRMLLISCRRRAGTAIDCRFAMGYIVRARSLAVDAEIEVRGSVSLVRIFDVTLLDGSLLPAPIMGWPDLEAFGGRWGLGGCREVIRMGRRRGIRRRRGLGGCREVSPGTEQSTVPLTRRSRMAK
jgi:hypothetical protein